jgi:hypothetical protein
VHYPRETFRGVLLPPDALGHLTHHPWSQCPQQLGMVVSEVPLSR